MLPLLGQRLINTDRLWSPALKPLHIPSVYEALTSSAVIVPVSVHYPIAVTAATVRIIILTTRPVLWLNVAVTVIFVFLSCPLLFHQSRFNSSCFVSRTHAMIAGQCLTSVVINLRETWRVWTVLCLRAIRYWTV
jgi:hypothetical protein